MKVISHRPALLSRLGDLVERNVTSDLEILQTSPFPLIPFPSGFKDTPNLGSLLTESVQFKRIVNVANAAQDLTNLFILSKGIWRISWALQYFANYTALTNDGFALYLVTPAGNSYSLVEMRPTSQNVQVDGDRVISLENDTTIIRYFLATNGIGQSHLAGLTLSLAKYF